MWTKTSTQLGKKNGGDITVIMQWHKVVHCLITGDVAVFWKLSSKMRAWAIAHCCHPLSAHSDAGALHYTQTLPIYTHSTSSTSVQSTNGPPHHSHLPYSFSSAIWCFTIVSWERKNSFLTSYFVSAAEIGSSPSNCGIDRWYGGEGLSAGEHRSPMQCLPVLFPTHLCQVAVPGWLFWPGDYWQWRAEARECAAASLSGMRSDSDCRKVVWLWGATLRNMIKTAFSWSLELKAVIYLNKPCPCILFRMVLKQLREASSWKFRQLYIRFTNNYR